MSDIDREITMGYLRPSLRLELECAADDGRVPAEEIARFREHDRAAGYVPHREVYEARKAREAAIKRSRIDKGQGRARWALQRTTSRVSAALRRKPAMPAPGISNPTTSAVTASTTAEGTSCTAAARMSR